MRRVFFIFLGVSAILGQDPDRTLTLAAIDTEKRLEEVAGILKSTSGAAIATDSMRKTVTVQGTPDQLSLAEWLANELNRPAEMTRPCAPRGGHTFRLPGAGGSVGVFCFREGIPLNEFYLAVRRVREETTIRNTYSLDGSRVLVVQGTEDQVAQAARVLAGTL